MLETELNDIRLHSAYQKQKLDELEARLRAADSTYVDHPEDESLTECSETPPKVSQLKNS